MGRDTLTLSVGSIGLARLILRSMGPLGTLGLIPGGVMWREGCPASARAEALRGLPALAHSHGIRLLLCNTTSPADEKIFEKNLFLPVFSGGFSAELDLTPPAAQRRKNLHGKWRNRLKKAESSDISVTHSRFSPHRHASFLTAEQTQRRIQSYRALPLDFVRAAAQIAPENTRMFEAKSGGKPLAAMLFLLHETAATYHIATTTIEGRARSAHTLLLWRASQWLATNGFTRLDLGPVETETAPGLARFKLGIGARPVQRGATVLYSRSTAPLGWLNAMLSRKAAHVAAAQSDQSYR